MQDKLKFHSARLRFDSKRRIPLYIKQMALIGMAVTCLGLSGAGCALIVDEGPPPEPGESALLHLFPELTGVLHGLPAGSIGGLTHGDFDCDGRQDLALGDPDQSIGNVLKAGAVHVQYGSGETEAFSLVQLDTIPVAENDAFGFSLAAGDFDGSDCDDLAIGAPGFDGNLQNAGRVYVVRGYPNGGLYPDADNAVVLDSSQKSGYFGTSLTTGRFNDDRFRDLAVGMPKADVSGERDAGTVAVYHGSTTGLVFYRSFSQNDCGDGLFETCVGGPGDKVKGDAEEDDLYGFSLVAGDFDGNGFDDLAIGVVGEDKGAGAVSVLYAKDDGHGLSADPDDLWTQDSKSVKGAKEDLDGFGFALAVGDFDCTGYRDLAIGVPGENIGNDLDNAGAVNVIYGGPDGLVAKNGKAIHDDDLWHQEVQGIAGRAAAEYFFGAALAAGRLTGDTCDDLVIATPAYEVDGYRAGAVNILLGSVKGLAGTGSQFLSQNSKGVSAALADTGDFFGAALTIGNLDGDQGNIHELAVRVNDGDTCAAHMFYGLVPEPIDADELFQCAEVTESPWTSGYTIKQPGGEYYTEPADSEPASGDNGDVLSIQSATFQLVQ